jgi:hypothetical protein
MFEMTEVQLERCPCLVRDQWAISRSRRSYPRLDILVGGWAELESESRFQQLPLHR